MESIENHIFRLGDKLLLIEELPFCDSCAEDTAITIHELKNKDLTCFDGIKIGTLSKWADSKDNTPQFVIHPLKIGGTRQMLEKYFEDRT